jgi:hypothetical protein
MPTLLCVVYAAAVGWGAPKSVCTAVRLRTPREHIGLSRSAKLNDVRIHHRSETSEMGWKLKTKRTEVRICSSAVNSVSTVPDHFSVTRDS